MQFADVAVYRADLSEPCVEFVVCHVDPVSGNALLKMKHEETGEVIDLRDADHEKLGEMAAEKRATGWQYLTSDDGAQFEGAL